MNRLYWRVSESLGRRLEPEDRDAILGDLLESNTTGGRALGDVLGLAVRREIARWASKRPWFCLFALVIPCGALLSLIASLVAAQAAIYAWLYLGNWTGEYLKAGFRSDLFHHLAAPAISFVTLACLAWCIGFAIGVLSRSAAWLNGALLVLVITLVQIGLAPGRNPGNSAVFSQAFYNVVLPSLLLLLLALAPAFTGIYYGAKNYRQKQGS